MLHLQTWGIGFASAKQDVHLYFLQVVFRPFKLDIQITAFYLIFLSLIDIHALHTVFHCMEGVNLVINLARGFCVDAQQVAVRIIDIGAAMDPVVETVGDGLVFI